MTQKLYKLGASSDLWFLLGPFSEVLDDSSCPFLLANGVIKQLNSSIKKFLPVP